MGGLIEALQPPSDVELAASGAGAISESRQDRIGAFLLLLLFGIKSGLLLGDIAELSREAQEFAKCRQDNTDIGGESGNIGAA